MNYVYKLTEEISRWAFEVHVHRIDAWDIIFTNPTAGPWKRVEATDPNGLRGEVYRFPRDDERPDIVMVNDQLNVVLIFEAKDSLGKLTQGNQIPKSCSVVIEMARTLGELRDNQYWNNRWNYSFFNALLWGSEEKGSATNLISSTLKRYSDEMQKYSTNIDPNVIIGIESYKNSEGQILLSAHAIGEEPKVQSILESLHLSNSEKVDGNSN